MEPSWPHLQIVRKTINSMLGWLVQPAAQRFCVLIHWAAGVRVLFALHRVQRSRHPHPQEAHQWYVRAALRCITALCHSLRRSLCAGQFVLKMLELFDSEDTREREYLKTILHR